MTEKTLKRTVFKIPDDVKKAFKAKTALEGVSMNEKVNELIKEYIQE